MLKYSQYQFCDDKNINMVILYNKVNSVLKIQKLNNMIAKVHKNFEILFIYYYTCLYMT